LLAWKITLAMLVAAEVTSMIWMKTIFGRETWLEDLIVVDFGAILSCAYWLVLFIIYKAVRGILLRRRKRKGKKVAEEQLLEGRVG
jgi:hypothetical protein